MGEAPLHLLYLLLFVVIVVPRLCMPRPAYQQLVQDKLMHED